MSKGGEGGKGGDYQVPARLCITGVRCSLSPGPDAALGVRLSWKSAPSERRQWPKLALEEVKESMLGPRSRRVGENGQVDAASPRAECLLTEGSN